MTRNGAALTCGDFKHIRENDDLYTLHAVVEDLAGNKSEGDLVFSVNRFGSVYVIDDKTKKLCDDYYTNKPQSVSITEINVDKLTYKEVSADRDGDLKELEDGKDYKVTAQGNDKSWKSFTYTLDADNFKEDGNYSVMVYSEDRATNTQDNRSEGKAIDFAVDQTPPSIVTSGISSELVHKGESLEIEISITDNLGSADLKAYRDDTLLGSYSFDEVEDAKGNVKLRLPARDDYQTIKLVSKDLAGNSSEAVFDNVIVSMNPAAIESSNTGGNGGNDNEKGIDSKNETLRNVPWWLYGIIGGLSLSCLIIGVLLVDNRRKAKKSENNTENAA
jgi:hypothetical protein